MHPVYQPFQIKKKLVEEVGLFEKPLLETENINKLNAFIKEARYRD